MTFKQELQHKLQTLLSQEDLSLLPTGYQRVGDIIILNLPEQLVKNKKLIAEKVLELTKVRAICNKTGAITGTFREPQIEFLAGDENTTTIHLESGINYKFDVRKIMFAKGNVTERVRIAHQIDKNEIIVDRFAGIGYFSLPIAKIGKPKKIYAIELNPISFQFFTENIKLNKIKNIEPINGDNREIIEDLSKTIKADRVLMSYLPPPKEFLPWAFKIIKRGGMLHYEDIVNADEKEKQKDIDRIMDEIQEIAQQYNFTIKLQLAKCIKSYGPKKDHYVFDIMVN